MHLPLFICCIFLTASFSLSGQSISGVLPPMKGQEIRLEGFEGLETYPIARCTVDARGYFRLGYAKTGRGVGYLMSADDKPFFVILSGEDVELQGEALALTETMQVLRGAENQAFERYAREHPRREQALSAWDYLLRIYANDPLFAVQEVPVRAIREERRRIRAEDSTFLATLPPDSYVRWYLPTRKLVSSVSTIAQYRPEEIPATIAAFRRMDYSDPRLYKSGLWKDAIESHFWLLENSGLPLDSVFLAMQVSIDSLLPKLLPDQRKLNALGDHLFDLLERRSMFQASEYLALRLLNEEHCILEPDLANQLETYRAMRKGNIAPDLAFRGDRFSPGYPADAAPKKLSDLKSRYTLVAFGAGWCPKCTQELAEISGMYPRWKAQGVEVVFISLDEDRQAFSDFARPFPFLSSCDYRKWESPAVKEYHVFSTPTLFLLDAERKILLRPNSARHMDAWVDWYLVQGKK